MSHDQPCPCDSGLNFEACCGPLLRGDRPAATALQLMRSRYTAYTCRDGAYLLQTWHPSTRPSLPPFDEAPIQWRGLKIISMAQGQAGDSEGRVAFVARYKINGRAGRLEEHSRFVQEDGRWFYVAADGT